MRLCETLIDFRSSNADSLVQFLFLEPNAADPLNKEAAEDLRLNRDGFRRNARTAMGGGSVKGQSYDRVLK
jgi:ubiquitin-conjugating enzyme E2 M